MVSGTCFADSGNEVTCVDIDEQKIAGLREGVIPIYEPGLKELVQRNVGAKRLFFTTNLAEAVKPAQIIYLAVGTPQGDDGAADLSALWIVAEQLAPHLSEDALVVTKSTVPVGTNAKLFGKLRELTGRDCRVASNPEFLKEGAAIDDFTKPRSRCRWRKVCRRRQIAPPALQTILTDGQTVLGNVAGKRRADQIRRQRTAGHEDQLYQPDGQRLRTF